MVDLGRTTILIAFDLTLSIIPSCRVDLTTIGIICQMLSCIKSYFVNRTPFVKTGSTTSPSHRCAAKIRIQPSDVLSLFTTPLSDVVCLQCKISSICLRHSIYLAVDEENSLQASAEFMACT